MTDRKQRDAEIAALAPSIEEVVAMLDNKKGRVIAGDGSGEALPPLPDSAYPEGAKDLEEAWKREMRRELNELSSLVERKMRRAEWMQVHKRWIVAGCTLAGLLLGWWIT